MNKAVIFDMDGVMIDTELLQSKSWEFILKEHGIEPILEETGVIHTIGIRAPENWDKLREKYTVTSDWELSFEKRGKPFPDVFLQAAHKLGVKPKDCIVLEDAESGIKAGKNAGMKVIAIPTKYTKGHDFSEADLIVSSLKDISWNTFSLLFSL